MYLNNPEIAIEMEDVKMILGNHFKRVFKNATETATCPLCPKEETALIVIKKLWLNHIGDIIIEGWCKDCTHPIEQYVEASNYPGAYDQAMAIRELKMEVLNDYEWRLSS